AGGEGAVGVEPFGRGQGGVGAVEGVRDQGLLVGGEVVGGGGGLVPEPSGLGPGALPALQRAEHGVAHGSRSHGQGDQGGGLTGAQPQGGLGLGDRAAFGVPGQGASLGGGQVGAFPAVVGQHPGAA